MQQSPFRLSPEQLLVAIGEALYGHTWRRPLARALGLSSALVARLGAGAPVSASTQRVLAQWARDEIARETVRYTRRVELLTAASVLIDH